MAYQLNQWHKAYVAIGCAGCMWLAAQAPVGKWGKGVFLTLGLLHSVAVIRIAKPLIREEAYSAARAIVVKELKATELTLEATQIKHGMAKKYATEPTSEATYEPEVINELRESLEALWEAVATEPDGDLQASTNQKILYLALVSLLESGKPETYLIEEVLGMEGRNFQKGKKLLQQILAEGGKNGW
jgi:hypothetical protein